MKHEEYYKVRGKKWKLLALKAALIMEGVQSNYNIFGAYLFVTIKRSNDLLVLQKNCSELGLKYKRT